MPQYSKVKNTSHEINKREENPHETKMNIKVNSPSIKKKLEKENRDSYEKN